MPDFYSGSVKGLVGNWDLMGSGNYNGKGYVPAGFLVFHIDYDPSVWTSTTLAPNSYFMRRYELFYANNSPSLFSEWAYPYGETNQLTNTSTPAAKLNNLNIDGSRLMSKPITDMTVAGGLASFSFIMPSTTGVGDLTAKTAPEVLCHVGLVDIVRDAQGHIRKKIRVNR